MVKAGEAISKLRLRLPPIKLDITESQIGHGRQKRKGWRNSMEGQKTTCTLNENLFLWGQTYGIEKGDYVFVFERNRFKYI